MAKTRSAIILLIGIILVMVSITPTYSQLSIIPLNPPSLPSQVLLSVPFYSQDVSVLYLNPDGLCRFASREMIIAYWINEGYMMGLVPSQKDLFIEEAQAPYNETMYYISFIRRGCYAETGFPWKVDLLGFYAGGLYTRFDGDTAQYIYRMKYYLSEGVPLEFGLYINHGIPTNGGVLPNHAVVLVGYNATGWFYHNPRGADDPTNGPNKYVNNNVMDQGIENEYWSYTVAIPKTYTKILTTVSVQINGYQGYVSTFWEDNVPVYPPGQANILILQTGGAIIYTGMFPHDQQFGVGFGSDTCYPWAVNIRALEFFGPPTIKPLTPHTPEPIPTPPVNPPQVPPVTPPPTPPPIPVRPTPVYSFQFPWSLIIGLFMIAYWAIKVRT